MIRVSRVVAIAAAIWTSACAVGPDNPLSGPDNPDNPDNPNDPDNADNPNNPDNPADPLVCPTGYSASGGACLDIDECATANGGCGSEATCTNRPGAAPTCTPLEQTVIDRREVAGAIRGLAAGAPARVILGSDAYLVSQAVAADGSYRFDNVPDGRYFLTVEVAGYQTPPAQVVVVNASSLARRSSQPGTTVNFDTVELAGDTFRYSWHEDASRAGHQTEAYVDHPPSIVFLGDPVETPDDAATTALHDDYHVLLSDEDQPWTQEHTYRLLQTMRSIPQRVRDPYHAQALRPSKWVLTDDDLADDLTVTRTASGDTVRLSSRAFTYATPRLVELDGERGTFYSKRLHHAVTRYVTSDGTDRDAIDRILRERFGVATVVPDYAALTAPTTHEDAGSFASFHPQELLDIVEMFEEMPSGFHAIPGLAYLVRRKDGMPHPLYPAAPAVAWANPGVTSVGYIEFMDSAFTVDPDHSHRLILHEKAHFLWGHVLSTQLKAEWIALGGWFRDPGASSGWSTTDTTGFVSPYAHAINPDEDLAESISYFVLDPALLRSRALPKFEFIQHRLMHGTRYLATLPRDLTFEVLNLRPDYTYPGKITRVDIVAAGGSADDKRVTIELGLQTDTHVFDGASQGYLRLFSEIGTYIDVYLAPTTAEGTTLRGELTVSRLAKGGFWRPDQIVISDRVGNQRLHGVNDYGWKLYINNPLEDQAPPAYVPGSLTLEHTTTTYAQDGVDHPIQRVRATWLVEDDGLLAAQNAVYAALTTEGSYTIEGWGAARPAPTPGQWIATVDFYVTEYRRTGTYGVPYIMFFDQAGNRGDQRFSSSPEHQPLVTMDLVTADPDTVAPEVVLADDEVNGLRRIRVTAEPTNPENPTGETRVKITYQARDDRSGVGQVSYRLLDPQGISHFQYHYHPNFYTMFFVGDPTAWTTYEIDAVLPVGSPPGTWGLQELVLTDKASNRRTYNFVEIVRFDVEVP